MAIPSVRAFAPLMTQRVSLAVRSGYDTYGQPTYGSPVVYQAAVVGQTKLVRRANGQEAPSRQQVYLMGNPAIRPEQHQITLSTSDVGSTESYAIHPLIMAVDRYPFVGGQYVTCIYLE